MKDLLLLFIFSILWQSAISLKAIGGIEDVRFDTTNMLFNSNRIGVVEVKYKGNWGAMCNFGFDPLAASTVCFMMGYPPYGVPISNSGKRSSRKNILISTFDCKDSIALPANYPSLSTVHLGLCAFETIIPTECMTRQHDVVVACLEDSTMTTTTQAPVQIPIATVNCSSSLDDRKNQTVRLVGYGDTAGLVEVKSPKTGEWGSICADGFGVNEAKAICRMLCTSSDDLAFAFPVLYQYGRANDSQPIHLSNIICPEDARDLNQCVHAGWGNTIGCTHEMDVGVQCGPQPPKPTIAPYIPTLICEKDAAVVSYELEKNPGLLTRQIKLVDEGESCNFTVTDNSTHIFARIPFGKCGADIKQSSETELVMVYTLVREYYVPESGIITQMPLTFTATCRIPRHSNVTSEILAPPSATLPPIIAKRNISTQLSMFSDSFFHNELSQPIRVQPNNTVFVLVSLKNPQPTSKLILSDCWASDDPDSFKRTAIQKLIVDRCSVFPGLTVLPQNLTSIGFSFPAFFLGKVDKVVVPSLSNLFLFCTTRHCDIRENLDSCRQFCRAQKLRSPRIRRRRSTKFLNESQINGVISVSHLD